MPLLRRAQIHREGGDVTMAIVNYTQAIKLDPEDYEAYYQRAEMYEKVILLYVCVCVCDVSSSIENFKTFQKFTLV